MDKSIVLAASACRNTRYTGCQKIQINFEAQGGETHEHNWFRLSRTLVLHRHQQGERGYSLHFKRHCLGMSGEALPPDVCRWMARWVFEL